MTINTIQAYDATSANEHLLPLNILAAGYDTQAGGGTGTIAWTAAQYARHTNPYPAIHIDQDTNASDPVADVLDVESGAASDSEIVGWLRRARADYTAKVRPGQRWPAIYCSRSNVTSAVAILQAAGLSNVPFWVAEPGIGVASAIRNVENAIGPYPQIGSQFAFGTNNDSDVFSVPWVQKVAAPPIVQEDEQPMMFNTQAFAPFPAGKYTKLYLWRDFEDTTIRVAVLAGGKFTVNNYDTTPTAPAVVDLPAGTEGVSLSLATGTAPVGYFLA